MPLYEYRCSSHGKFEIFYKSLPSEAKQKSAPCPDCDEPGRRMLSTFSHVGANSEVGGKIVGSQTDESGRPIFTDVNGNTREIRTTKDVDAWCTVNALGKPRYVDYYNPVTGRKTLEPMRVGGLRPHPMTGEPVEDGPIIRESERLVPLGTDPEYIPPSESKTGLPLENGVLKMTPDKITVAGGLRDPESGKRMTIADCWGKEKLPGA